MVLRQDYELPDSRSCRASTSTRTCSLTFIDESDARAVRLIRHQIGVENIMWSSDYPHPVSSWPEFPEDRQRSASPALPEDERELIMSGNAKRVWNL